MPGLRTKSVQESPVSQENRRSSYKLPIRIDFFSTRTRLGTNLATSDVALRRVLTRESAYWTDRQCGIEISTAGRKPRRLQTRIPFLSSPMYVRNLTHYSDISKLITSEDCYIFLTHYACLSDQYRHRHSGPHCGSRAAPRLDSGGLRRLGSACSNRSGPSPFDGLRKDTPHRARPL